MKAMNINPKKIIQCLVYDGEEVLEEHIHGRADDGAEEVPHPTHDRHRNDGA